MKRTIKRFGILLIILVAFNTIGQSTGLQNGYGGVMTDQNFSLLGFYEFNFKDRLSLIGRVGLRPGYVSSDGFYANSLTRISARWALSTNERGGHNEGWYVEAASPVLFDTGATEFRIRSQVYGLVGYRGKLGSRFIAEASLGASTNFRTNSTFPINNALIQPALNIGLGFVLFSK